MSTDDIKAPSIIKLRETLSAMTAEEKGTAAIPSYDELAADAQRGSFVEGVWQGDFTIDVNNDNLYWDNLTVIAPYAHRTDGSNGKPYFNDGLQFLPDLQNLECRLYLFLQRYSLVSGGL